MSSAAAKVRMSLDGNYVRGLIRHFHTKPPLQLCLFAVVFVFTLKRFSMHFVYHYTFNVMSNLKEFL